MELFQNLAIGLSTAFEPANLGYALLGCIVGTAIGVLPGLGPLATIAMLLPLTYSLQPESALIMLAGIYYGASYGGSTTAILVNLPGESSSAVTTLDGYQMARQGRAGVALTTAAVGSFVAGSVATLVIAALAAPLSSVALAFGPAEFFSLMVLGLVVASVLSNGSLLESVGMVFVGVLISFIGTDVNTGVSRFTLGIRQLFDGVDFVALSMGIFGFAEIVRNLRSGSSEGIVFNRVANLFPTRQDVRRMTPAIARGTVLGSMLGILPGGGTVLAAFVSYIVEKKVSKHPEEFGHGAIEGVAGPESANNAGAQTSFIPLLTLGLPSTAVMALMVGAMTIHNIQPGPQVMTTRPELFWGLIASMWVGNLMLLILNLPLVGLWVKLVNIPYRLLFPAILSFCAIGAYSVNNSTFEIYQAAFFGLFGYLLVVLRLPAAPLLLGLVLGPGLEENFRRAMLLSHGSLTAFLTPLSLIILLAAVVAAAASIVPSLSKVREAVDD